MYGRRPEPGLEDAAIDRPQLLGGDGDARAERDERAGWDTAPGDDRDRDQ